MSTRRPSIRRTISSKSLLAYPDLAKRQTNIAEEDSFSVGDAEMHIEYHNVPQRMLWTGAIHSLIQFNFFPLLALILACILLIIFLSAFMYWSVSDSCGLGIQSFQDAWLFSFLAHTKASLAGPRDDTRFWHGCRSGGMVLFLHLFAGQVLTSVLLSSLAFNFQSISRRSISSFITLTMSQKAKVSSDNGEVRLNLTVAERNEVTYRKVSNVVVHIFVFDPAHDSPVGNIAVNECVGDVFLPQDMSFEIPKSLLFSPKIDIPSFCDVCGKNCRNEQLLRQHVQSMQDRLHIEALSALDRSLSEIPELTEQEAVSVLRARELQFIVILEGSDPVTTDRVQVQKIFRNYDIVSTETDKIKPAPCVSIDPEDGCPVVDYESFL
jgi:hypothetical protein